jgi:hypothetical protein
MALLILCSHCQHQMKVRDDLLGKQVRCPGCRGVCRVTAPAAGGGGPDAPTGVAVAPAPAGAEESSVRGEAREPGPAAGPRRKPRRPNVVPSRQVVLRVFVFLLGFLGSLAAVGLGGLWWSLQNAGETDPMFQAYPLLFVAAGLGLVGGVLGGCRWGWFAGLLMLAGVAAPAVFAPASLGCTPFLLVGGVLAFFVRSQKGARAAAEKAAASGRAPVSGGAGQVLGIVAASLGGVMVLTYFGFFVVFLSLAAASHAVVEHTKREWRERDNGPNEPPPIGGEPAAGEAGPAKEVPFESVQDEVQKAGAGVKLVKLDLGPAGLPLTLDAPEGCRFKQGFQGVEVVKDEHFALLIQVGKGDIASARDGLRGNDVLVNTPELVFFAEKWADKPSCHFQMEKVLGYQDFSVTNHTVVDEKRVVQNRADCLLMLKCARTLALKAPADPATALGAFLEKEPGKDDKGRTLRLNNKATDATLVLLRGNRDVRDLQVENTRVTGPGLVHLKGLVGLESLNLGSLNVADADLAPLSGLTGLKHLEVGGNNLSDEGMRHLAGLVNLESLELAGGWSDKFKGPGLARLAGCKKLKQLRLRLNLDDAALAHLKPLRSLTGVQIHSRSVLGPGLAELAALPDLKSLDVSGGKINDAGLVGVEKLVHLETLVLSNTEASGDGLAHLKKLSKLKTLDLAGTKVTDKGLAHLAGLVHLETLNLSGAPVTDAGAARLKGLTQRLSGKFGRHKLAKENSFRHQEAEVCAWPVRPRGSPTRPT